MNNRRRVVLIRAYILIVQLLSLFWGYNLGRTSRFSMFFEEEFSTRIFEGLERDSEAASLKYLDSKKTELTPWSVNTSHLDPFCITIVTQKRSKAEYIIRSTAYLLSRLESIQNHNYNSEEGPLPVKLYLTNTERPKEGHKRIFTFGTAVDIVHLEDYAAKINLPFVSIPLNKNEDEDGHSTWVINQVLDSMLVFDYAAEIGCHNLMILEDDGIVSRDFYTKVQDALEGMKKLEYFSIKIWYSDTYTGWSMDAEDIGILIVSTASVTICFAVLPLLLLRRVGRCRFMVLTFTYIWLFYLSLFYAIGKQSLFPRFQGQGVMKIGRHMGSTVGVVYPKMHFKGLSNYLKDKVEAMKVTPIVNWKQNRLKPVDLLIDDYADMILNLDTYLLLPNVVQHVGRFSSSVSKLKNQGSLRDLFQSNSFPKKDEVF